MTGEKVLIVRLAGIGDVIMASTLVGRIRREWPNATIHWLCGATAAPLVEQFDGVDAVIAIDEHRVLRGGLVARLGEILPLWGRLAAAGYSRVLLLHVDRRYRVLVAPLLAAKMSILSRRDAHGAMNPIPGRYLGDEYARLLDGVASRGPIDGHTSLASIKGASASRARAAADRSRVALVPGGTKNVLRESVLRRWPVDRYADVARALALDGCEIVLVGDAGDAWVRESFAGIGATDLIGQATLPETVAAIAACDLVISHDTGPMHIARLTRTPVLALFGPTMPAQFAPNDATTTTLWGGEHLACRPCYDGREFAVCSDNQCMTSISADVVVRTARTILARTRAATPDRSAPRAPSGSAPR